MKQFRSVLICLILFCSCKEEKKPVTKQEAQTFAENIQSSIAKRDGEFFDNAFSINSLMEILEQKAKDGNFKESTSSLKKGLKSKLKIGTQLVSLIGEGATYQLVRIYQQGDEQHAIFRLYDNGELNYHDMRMIKEKGQVRIADMFVYSTGENFSETIITMVDGLIANSDKEGSLKAAEKLKEARDLIVRNKGREALELIEELPEQMRNIRPVHIMKLQAAMISDDDSLYLKTIDEFNKQYPDNGKMSLMLMDGLLLHKEYDKALACLDQLDIQVGKDPLLDYYRALFYKLKEDKATARTYLLKLNAAMPAFADGAIELAVNYCDTKEWEKAASVIGKARSAKGFKPEYISQLSILYPEMEKYLRAD